MNRLNIGSLDYFQSAVRKGKSKSFKWRNSKFYLSKFELGMLFTFFIYTDGEREYFCDLNVIFSTVSVWLELVRMRMAIEPHFDFQLNSNRFRSNDVNAFSRLLFTHHFCSLLVWLTRARDVSLFPVISPSPSCMFTNCQHCDAPFVTFSFFHILTVCPSPRSLSLSLSLPLLIFGLLSVCLSLHFFNSWR